MPFAELHVLMEVNYLLIIVAFMHVTLASQYTPLLFVRDEGACHAAVRKSANAVW